jgi:hypothetical protein
MGNHGLAGGAAYSQNGGYLVGGRGTQYRPCYYRVVPPETGKARGNVGAGQHPIPIEDPGEFRDDIGHIFLTAAKLKGEL